MFAISFTDTHGVALFLKRSTPRSIDWTAHKGFAKQWATRDEAERSHDYKRAAAASLAREVVQVSGAK